MLYTTLLLIHSWLRWVVLAAAVHALFRAIRGATSAATFEPSDRKAGLIFVASLDSQVLLGLILYFVSPLTPGSGEAFKLSMKDPMLRFFAVEHLTAMILALVAAHVGSVLARKASEDVQKFKRSAISIVVSLLLIVGGLPWLMRPLFRF
ncbi:MAG: hypothetical protein U0165_02620 [Polyangiaceae bacterium]